MGIFESLKRARDIARLRKQVRQSPSPATYGALAERYVALDELDESLRVAEKGLDLFPNSERLAHVRIFTKKKRLTGDIRKLQEDLRRRPNPGTYAQLAEIFRELGDHEEALRIATECADRFPLSENPYLLQGEVRLERFLRDQIAKDATIAETALKKVTRLNVQNVKAHLLLAELYYVVGDIAECRKRLRSVLTVTPTARDVQSFLQGLDGRPEDEHKELGFVDRVERVEETGQFANSNERFPNSHPHMVHTQAKSRARVDMESLKEAVVHLGDQAGVVNSIILDRDGEILAEYTHPDSLSRRQFAGLVTAIRSTADDASRRMDTGALVRAEIEGPGGNVTVARIRNVTIALLYQDPLRPDRVWELLQDFIARNLTSDREVVRA